MTALKKLAQSVMGMSRRVQLKAALVLLKLVHEEMLGGMKDVAPRKRLKC